MKTKIQTALLVQILACSAFAGVAVPDVMKTAPLRDVRLRGAPAVKLERFIAARMTSAFAQEEIFGEARSAFARRDDDARVVIPGRKMGGLWRGEFWGKLMIGTARVAEYLQDPALLAFVRAESHRLMALADADGYLGSYADRENVQVPDWAKPAMAKAYGWNTNWNLWNRKYAIWGLYMAYRATGDRAILASVEKQLDQWIAMMHRLRLPLHACGHCEKAGLPPMSVLKPLLLVYEETDRLRYLDYAEETLRDWDRADGACPNFFRNAGRADPISTWYPKCTQWAKTYEMLSCLDGILEHYRATGSQRSLRTVAAIRDNILANEANVLGGVGYCDQLNQTARRMNAVSEVCDAIHWIRLNLDLFLLTGEERYVDAMEVCYLNNFLAGVYRDGSWGAFAVRGHGAHTSCRQCGYAYNHCCVNNIPRTWMDVASAVVTRDRAGAFHVNLYEDATVTLDGVRFEIAGNYPVSNRVTVTVSDPAAQVVFRKPAWCPKMDVARAPGAGRYALAFDMNPRLLERALPHDPDGDDPNNWICRRYCVEEAGSARELKKHFRTTPAATVMWGPLVLARSRRLGATAEELTDPATLNGRGYAVKAAPLARPSVWGAWRLTFSKAGEADRTADVCDYQSAGDDPVEHNTNVYSIWF